MAKWTDQSVFDALETWKRREASAKDDCKRKGHPAEDRHAGAFAAFCVLQSSTRHFSADAFKDRIDQLRGNPEGEAVNTAVYREGWDGALKEAEQHFLK